ncbi:CapA family protein [Candidatus Beckwithbacteria bacterium]|nr:CapA family protein [Candidatus Beckwithbacteria bacterium]
MKTLFKNVLILFILFSISILSSFFIFKKNQNSPIILKPNFTINPTPTQILYSPQVPSINQILNDNHDWTATLSAQKLRTLIVTGDVIPARSVNTQTLKANDFTWAFAKTADFLKTADVTFINLETPLIPNCQLTDEGMHFCGDQRHIQGLTFAGVDVANLANNHTGNYGLDGLEQTEALLNQAGIETTGFEDNLAIKNVRGIRFAFLGYNEVPDSGSDISLAEPQKIRKEITQTKTKADVIIVTFHWGTEYTTQITDNQRQLAHLAIDNGADLIIGNHPHWVQPLEIYKGKLITYAHGNFIFDQMWSQETREGVVGKYTFYDDKLIDAQFFPVQIDDYGQPHFVTNQNQKQRIMAKLNPKNSVY